MKKIIIKTILSILTFIFLGQVTEAQTTYQVNGRTLLLQNGVYSEIRAHDTILIDKDNIVVKFLPTLESVGIAELENVHGLSKKYKLLDQGYHFKLPPNVDFIIAVNSVLNTTEVEAVYFGYLFKGNTANIISQNTYRNGINDSISTKVGTGSGRWEPNDKHKFESWELKKTRVFFDGYSNEDEYAWNYSVGAPNIIVAVIDNGLVWDDNDFTPDNNLGYDYFDDDPDVSPMIPDGFDIEMGTSKASIIAGRTANEHALCGIAGGFYTGESSPPITLMILRAMQNNGEYQLSMAIFESIIHAADGGARIINLGFSIDDEDPLIASAISYASNKGVVIFSPTGDKGESKTEISWPARRDDVIAVGGTNWQDSKADWFRDLTRYSSQWGEFTEISLPAENIEVLDIFGPDGITAGSSQTSTTDIACAMASGIAALMLSVNPCLTPDEIRDLLIQSCEKVGGYEYDWNLAKPGHSKALGYGRVDAYQAVLAAMNLVEPGMDITQNTTWDKPKYFNSNVVVKTGATLTVQSTVKFDEQVRLIVEKGGTLVVDGGKLTSRCKKWDGIIVAGDDLLPQSPETNQGKVAIINNGTIENAMCGVRLCIPNDGKSSFDLYGGGGILWAEGASFLNCNTAISFAPYQYDNSSRIILSSFSVDDKLAPETGFAGFIKMNSVNDIVIKGCAFENNCEVIRNTGIGINAYNSNFTVDQMCRDNADNPCPPEFQVNSKFALLDYGIYAENIATSKLVNVYHSDFNGNIHSIYGSALILPEFIWNNFFVWDNQPTPAYGLYLNNCNMYHVEKNSFLGNDAKPNNNIGVYIRNSGGDENYIYNNSFEKLKYASVADGINRSSLAQTGLCFKCNDFVNCVNDIIVPLPDPNYVSINHGIRSYQGKPGSSSTDAAGNTFSTNGTLNFGNYLNPITYVVHQYKLPSETKIIPDPRTTNTVGLQGNASTTYTKQGSCPPWNAGDSPESLKEQMAIATTGMQATEMQLAAFTDGGDTEALNDVVQTAQTGSSLTLYEDLLATSPYLSDTVMKSGIGRTDVLPDAMLRDILVANPQSAKSGDVMQALDERTVPLPDEMKEEVLAGIDIFASKDMLNGQLAAYNDQWGRAYSHLATIYAADTILTRANDSLAQLYNTTATPAAKYSLALLEADRGNTAAATQAVAAAANQFALRAEELNVNVAYGQLVEQLIAMYSDYADYISADSLSLTNLASLALNDVYLPGAVARNILHAAGLLDYAEPINLGISAKSRKYSSQNTDNPFATKANKLFDLVISPNPAKDYCIASYLLPADSENASIIITTLTGVKLFEAKLKDKRNSIVIPMTNLPRGMVIVQLMESDRSVSSCNVILN